MNIETLSAKMTAIAEALSAVADVNSKKANLEAIDSARKEYPFWDWRTRQCRSAPEYCPALRLWVVRSHNPMDEIMSGLDEIGICDDFGNLDLKSRYDYLRLRK